MLDERPPRPLLRGIGGSRTPENLYEPRMLAERFARWDNLHLAEGSRHAGPR